MKHGLAKRNKNINLSSISQHFNLYHNTHIFSKDKLQLNLKITES